MSKIILKNVGRGKVSKEIEVGITKNLEEVGNMAYREVRRHLMSSEVELIEDENQDIEGTLKMTVLVGGYRPVGEVHIVMDKQNDGN